MIRKTALLITAVLLVASCKATVEGEQKKWASNKKRVQELSALYSGFSTALSAQQKKAEAVMKAAEGESDQEAKLKKMRQANTLLGGGFVGKLGGIDRKKKRVRDKITTATTKARSNLDRMAAKQVSKNARQVLQEAESRLKRGAKTTVGAGAVLRQVDTDLSDAMRNLDRVISKFKKKAKKGKLKKKFGKGKGKGGKGKPAAGKPAANRWKCEYCQRSNATSAGKCTNCGAPRP